MLFRILFDLFTFLSISLSILLFFMVALGMTVYIHNITQPTFVLTFYCLKWSVENSLTFTSFYPFHFLNIIIRFPLHTLNTTLNFCFNHEILLKKLMTRNIIHYIYHCFYLFHCSFLSEVKPYSLIPFCLENFL